MLTDQPDHTPDAGSEPKSMRIALKLKVPGGPSVLERAEIRKLMAASDKVVLPRLVPLFGSLTPGQFLELTKRAQQMDSNYKATAYGAWQQFECPPSVDPNELAAALRRLEEVDTAYVMRPGPPPAVNPHDDPRFVNQGYLQAAPLGVDAPFAWNLPGGDGKGMGLVDLEQGWNLSHEDLAAANISTISGLNQTYRRHGTQVLGVVLMVDNTVGGIGVAPSARGRVVSQWRTAYEYNTADAIVDATSKMDYGDILLIEAQEYDPVGLAYYWPVEIALASYEAIRLATALGIVVIQAAGNGNRDLDLYIDAYGDAIFDRSATTYRDSGAVLVGASTSSLPHVRTGFSNHGSRVDCYAWGELVDTASTNAAGTDNSGYTTGFNGTSAASAIVAGVALVVQGLASLSSSGRLDPDAVRALLATHGTASANPPIDRIGVMPDLRAIAGYIVGPTADETSSDSAIDAGERR